MCLVERQHIPYLEVPTGAQIHHDTAPEAGTLTIIQPMQSSQIVCFKENKVECTYQWAYSYIFSYETDYRYEKKI